MIAPPGRATAAAVGVLAAVLGIGLGGCGGSAKVSDVVPHSTPEITPPEGHTAENAAAKKTHVTTVGPTTGASGETGHHESSEGSSSSSEGSTGGSGSEESSSGASNGSGGGTSAGEHGASTGEKSSSENGGASAP